MHILVFLTNLNDRQQVQKLKPVLESMPGLVRWSVDLEDCDRVLRVVMMHSIQPVAVLEKIRAYGVECEEMDG